MNPKNQNLSQTSIIEYKGWFAHNKKLILIASLIFLIIVSAVVALVILVLGSTPDVVNYAATIESVNKTDVDYSTESINITFITDVPDNEINNVTASYIENDTNKNLGYTSTWTSIGTNEYSGTIVASDLTPETSYQGKVVLDYKGTTLDEYDLSFETLPFIIDFTLNTNTVVIDPNLTSGNVALGFDTNILDVENITASVQVDGTTIGSTTGDWVQETENNYSGNILLSGLTPFIDYDANIIFTYNGDTISDTPIIFNTNNEISNMTAEIGNVTSTTASINVSFESNATNNSNIEAIYTVGGIEIGSTNTWTYDSTSSSYKGTISLTDLDSSTKYDGVVTWKQNGSMIYNTNFSFTTLDLISNIVLTPLRIDSTSEDINIKFQTDVIDTNNITATYVDDVNGQMGSTSTWTDNGDGSFSGAISLIDLTPETTYLGQVKFTYNSKEVASQSISFKFSEVIFNNNTNTVRYDRNTQNINVSFETNVSDEENITATYVDDTNGAMGSTSSWTLESDGSFSGVISVTDLTFGESYSGQVIFTYYGGEIASNTVNFDFYDVVYDETVKAENFDATTEIININFKTQVTDVDNIEAKYIDDATSSEVASTNIWLSHGDGSYSGKFYLRDLVAETSYSGQVIFSYRGEEITSVSVSFYLTYFFINTISVDVYPTESSPTQEALGVSFYSNIPETDSDQIYGEIVETSNPDVPIATNNDWALVDIESVNYFGRKFFITDLTPGTDYECYINFYYNSSLLAVSDIFTFTTMSA